MQYIVSQDLQLYYSILGSGFGNSLLYCIFFVKYIHILKRVPIAKVDAKWLIVLFVAKTLINLQRYLKITFSASNGTIAMDVVETSKLHLSN